MADSDKQILITPNISQTAQPEIKFVGKDNSPLYLKVLDDNSLSFEGTEGQVFSISPTMSSGDIFSVNDISGIQSIAVNADGTVALAPVSGNVGIGKKTSLTAKLHISTSGETDALRVDVDSSDDPDASPFVIAEDGRVGIGTASPLSDMALTLNGDGTSYEGLAFQVGGSTKWKFSSDSTSMYVDSQANGLDWRFRMRDTAGALRTLLTFDGGVGGGTDNAPGVIIGNDAGTDSSAGTCMNKLQVNVGTTAGVQDFNDGILIVNNDASIADGDVIGGIGFDTRDGNVPSRTTEASAAIVAVAAEAQGDDDKGGHLTFLTSAVDDDDDTASSERVSITSAGHLVVGATAITGTASHGIIEVAHATQANVRVTDTNAGSTDFAQSGNDTYILNRHASGKIYIKPGNGDHSIELASNGQVKFNNAYTFPTAVTSGNDYVLTAQTDGSTAWAAQSGGGVSLSGSTNDQLVTVTGSNAIQGESNLTLSSGGILALSGNMTIVDSHATTPALVVEQDNATGSAVIQQWKTQGNELTEVRNNGNIFFHLSTDGGASNESILSYTDTAGDERNMLMIDTGTVCLLNRGPNGDVEIRANSSTAGSGGESVIISATSSGMQLGGSGARVTTIKDEDAMGSNSATALATQQSIKAYVDNQSPGTADFLIMEADTGSGNHSNDAGTEYNVNDTTPKYICFKNEQKKDSIYTHSTSSSSEEVTVTEAGTYMIFYAVITYNLDDNRFVAEAAIYHQPSGGSYTERDYTRATSYSRGSGGSGVYDFDIQLNFAGALELGAGDKIKLGVKQNDADDSSNTVRVQKDGTMLTMVRVAKTGNKASIISVSSGTTTLTNAQSGSVVYLTSSGAVNLPSSIEKGVQFVIINDTGSNETPGLNSNTHVLGTHGAMSANTARTYVAVSNGNVAAIG